MTVAGQSGQGNGQGNGLPAQMAPPAVDVR